METAAPESYEENRQLVSPGDRFGARMQSNSSAVALQARLFEKELQNLSDSFKRLTEDGSVVRAAAMVVAARRRFVLGAGKSFAYANLLAADMSAGLSQVTLVDGTVVRALDVLSDVRDSDVLVAFSFRRYRRQTLLIAEQFVESGGTLVAITDDAESPLVKSAAESVVVPTGSASFADSPTAVASTIHLLSTLTTASSKGARRRIAERERIGRKLDIYLEN
ncbi:MurR/RpiR family transcriptional regulator [Cryobacterium sp. Y50]|uniref:MurR/RpiR family transcriptional regulator n=1 Tax=Cryobacterium sp. Y50 TaxID=2048286 RepID=UPI000CE35287|nr:SIS domain-containing protein [Cryobacterium sp. Y50]